MGYTKAEWIVLSISFFIMLGIALLLRLKLLDKPEKIQKIPFIVVTLLMIFGEVVKQIHGIIVGYELWWIPLHFCSTFFLWFFLAEFTKGEFSRGMKNVAFLGTLCVVFAMYLSPKSIIGSACENLFSDFLTAHSFFFHQLVVFYFLLSISLNRIKFRKKDCYYWAVSMSSYFVVAAVFAYALNTNYFSILQSNAVILENFRLTYGQTAYNICQATVLIFAPVALILLLEKWKVYKRTRK